MYWAQGLRQRQAATEAMGNHHGLIADDLRDADAAAMRIIPAGEQHQPVLEQDPQQFGVDPYKRLSI